MLRAITLALALAASSQASAQEAIAFKCPAPGVTITFSDNSFRTFTRQEGLTCFYKLPNNTEGAWMAGVASPASTLGARFKAEIEKIWPARVGARSEFLQHEQWGYQIIIRERKVISVPAGTFDVLVIDVVEEGIRQNMHKSIRRYFYAPDVGYAVKYEPILERGVWGGTAPQTVEVIKISSPNAAVNPPTVPAPTTMAPAASGPSALGNIAERLSQLKDLFDKKLITQSEYDKKRQEILSGL